MEPRPEVSYQRAMASSLARIHKVLPGLGLCLAVALLAIALQWLEEAFARSYVQAIVLAILVGVAVRTVWAPPISFASGITFSGKTLLELAVMLLGATMSTQLIVSAGPGLLIGILLIVAVALAASYGVARALGLSHRVSVLIASGNSICGNSAIAAVAPVIGASAGEVVSSIAFTAILGVVVVVSLPLLIPLAGLSEVNYGIVAGLTVYAVPQVLAATLPVGAVSAQIGTFVKLVRVLLLGPLVIGLSMLPRPGPQPPSVAPTDDAKIHLPLTKAVPWFIVGFLALMALRSLGLIPDPVLRPLALTSEFLTVIAMAALGLAVDVRVLARSGGRMTVAVILSLLLLACLSLGLVMTGLVGSV